MSVVLDAAFAKAIKRIGIATGFLIGIAVGIGPALADAQRANDIINAFQIPKTRSLKSGLSNTCYEAIDAAAARTRGASKAELDQVNECTSDSPTLSFKVTFAKGSADLDYDAIPVLQTLGEALEDESFQSAQFIVGGHTDKSGSRGLNLSLSKRRANAVRDYLVQNYRVSGRQLRAIGYGYDKLAVPYDPYAGENRRVEIVRTR